MERKERNSVPQISVIITIHNAEKYIEECLDSVTGQTFTDIEILCMDGGSTDATPRILQKYADQDWRIRIVQDANTSYGHKVNRGIDEARGKYVSVLESDDMYEPFMLERLYHIAEQYQVDFANGNYTCFYTVNDVMFSYETKMYAQNLYGKVIYNRENPKDMGIIPRFWTGLFRRDFLTGQEIRMNESPGASFQDMSFRFLTSALAKRSYHIDEALYLYRIDNPGSSMHDGKKTTVIAEEHDFLHRQLYERNITNRYVWHNAYECKYRDFFGNMCNLRGKYREELFERYLIELEKDRQAIMQYALEGYSNLAEPLIKLSPSQVSEKVEQHAAAGEREDKRMGDFLQTITRRERIVIFGCGVRGRNLLRLLWGIKNRIIGLSDNNQKLWGTAIEEWQVCSPKEIEKNYGQPCIVIANREHSDEIRQQLEAMKFYDIIVY